MGSFEAQIRVLDKNIKSKFSHFVVKAIPRFRLPESLKAYLLEHHEAVVSPANSTNFKIGYFVIGRGNKKYDIVDETTLSQAYESATNNVVTLWVDPHQPAIKGKKRKAAEDKDSTDDEDLVEVKLKKKTKQDMEVERHLESLKAKHGGTYPEFKLRAWAVMMASGTHQSLEVAPNVPFFQSNKVGGVGKVGSSGMSKIAARGELLKQLELLKRLQDDGVLMNDEYLQQKEKILLELNSS